MSKSQPIGICDLCRGIIPPEDWYTSKGKPRMYCSIDCKNTANSRAGAPIRREKTLLRIARGEWQNPAELRPPTSDEQSYRARKGRKREVAEGRWRNPALSADARRKLSRPRKHEGILHLVIEKLKQGLGVADLSAEEQGAHRDYRKQLRDARREELNRQARERYHRRKKNKETQGG
jgi:hypothetical protein